MAPRGTSMKAGESSVVIHPQIRSGSRKAFINPADRQAKLPPAPSSGTLPSTGGVGNSPESARAILDVQTRKPTAPLARKVASRGATRPTKEKGKHTEQDAGRQRPSLNNSYALSAASTPTDTEKFEVAPHISGRGSGLTRVDKNATSKAIQAAWKGGRKNVSQMCEKISNLLDNPIMAADSERASIITQRYVRGWLLRKRRAAGGLFPVEEQSLCDGKVLLRLYGAKSFALDAHARRRKIREHYAAQKIQRFLSRFILKKIPPSPQDAAARTLQRCVRRCLAACVVSKTNGRLRLSHAVRSFPAAALEQASHLHASRLRNAAAARVQATWRGRVCRRRVEQEQEQKQGRVLRVQAVARGWAARIRVRKMHNARLLKHALGWWNKIMWTMASPARSASRPRSEEGRAASSEEESRPPSPDPEVSGRYTPAHVHQAATEEASKAREEEEVLLDAGMRLVEGSDEAGGMRRSLYLGEGEEEVVMEMGSFSSPDKGAHAAAAEEEDAEEEEEGKTSWRVLPGSRGGARNLKEAKEVWPEWYGPEVCKERGALARAMAEDHSAIRVQAAFRGHRARLLLAAARHTPAAAAGSASERRPRADRKLHGPGPRAGTLNGEAGAGARAGGAGAGAGAGAGESKWEVVTPVRGAGLPPTPGTRSGTAPATALPAPTPPSGRFSPPSASPSRPGSRGLAGLEEWKKGIAEQVHVIHAQLVTDSENRRRHTGRSRSPSPHPRTLSPGACTPSAGDAGGRASPVAGGGGGAGALGAAVSPPPTRSATSSPPPPPRVKSRGASRTGPRRGASPAPAHR